MKKNILFIQLVIISSISFAQQLPLNSQYFWSDYAVNPAFTGNTKHSSIQATYRNQWSGFKGSPKGYTLGVNHLVTQKNIGLGLVLFSDDHGGAIKQNGVILNYSYKVVMDDYVRLDFGVSGIINQYSYDESSIVASNLNDNILFSSQNSIVPDCNIGAAFVFDDNLKIGVSAQQLFQSNIRGLNLSNSNGLTNQFKRQYNMSFSYTIANSRDFSYNLYLLAKSTFLTPVQTDLGARLFYKGRAYLGLAYRSQDAISVLVGFKKDRFVIGYGYDITTSKIRNFSNGSHDLVLVYRYKENKSRKFRQRFNYYEHF
jgi:type IX secretion system PorP/SprF family membrane protein